MAERRSVAGVEGLAAEATRKSTRRKSHPLTSDEKVKKARREAERRSEARTARLASKAFRKSARRKTHSLTAEQKAKKAVADVTCYRKPRLLIEQKSKNVRIETERRNSERSATAVVRMIDDRERHRYATRLVTSADRAIANALVLGRMPNVLPESDMGNTSAPNARASREVQSNAQQREATRVRALKR